MQPFVVNLNVLGSGVREKSWRVGPEFFESFGNFEILDADLEVNAELNNHGLTVDAYCEIDGTVTVACDRCLDDLVITVETFFEETYTPDSDELDISQEVYDFVLTALPLQRVHPEGECNEETTRFLSK